MDQIVAFNRVDNTGKALYVAAEKHADGQWIGTGEISHEPRNYRRVSISEFVRLTRRKESN